MLRDVEAGQVDHVQVAGRVLAAPRRARSPSRPAPPIAAGSLDGLRRQPTSPKRRLRRPSRAWRIPGHSAPARDTARAARFRRRARRRARAATWRDRSAPVRCAKPPARSPTSSRRQLAAPPPPPPPTPSSTGARCGWRPTDASAGSHPSRRAWRVRPSWCRSGGCLAGPRPGVSQWRGRRGPPAVRPVAIVVHARAGSDVSCGARI